MFGPAVGSLCGNSLACDDWIELLEIQLRLSSSVLSSGELDELDELDSAATDTVREYLHWVPLRMHVEHAGNFSSH